MRHTKRPRSHSKPSAAKAKEKHTSVAEIGEGNERQVCVLQVEIQGIGRAGNGERQLKVKNFGGC